MIKNNNTNLFVIECECNGVKMYWSGVHWSEENQFLYGEIKAAKLALKDVTLGTRLGAKIVKYQIEEN